MIKNCLIISLMVTVTVWANADASSFTAVANTAFGMSHVTCVTWGGGKFVAGGSDGKISYSADGVKWTAVGDSKFGSTQINDICYGAGKFVAVGMENSENEAKIAYSTDGITWTLVDKSPFYKAECVVYGNGKFVAGGMGDGVSVIAYSVDGISWNEVPKLPFPFSFGSISAITYDSNGQYLAISYNGMGVESIVAYSTDALTWTIHATADYSEKAAIAYGDGKFIYAIDHTLAYTPDGVKGDVANGFNWDNKPNSVFGSSSITAIAYGWGMFVAGGKDGKLAYSTDGLTWSSLADSKFGATQINGIVFGNGKFIAVGNDGKIVYSN
jgi:hypothetical protein